MLVGVRELKAEKECMPLEARARARMLVAGSIKKTLSMRQIGGFGCHNDIVIVVGDIDSWAISWRTVGWLAVGQLRAKRIIVI